MNMSSGAKAITAGIVICLLIFIIYAVNKGNEVQIVSVENNVEESMNIKENSLTLRGEYIGKLVDIYEEMTHREISTDGDKPIFENCHEKIVKAWKLGIIGNNDIAFYYNESNIQYQKVLQLLYDTITLAKPDFKMDINEAGFYLNNCYDNVYIDNECMLGYAFAYKYNLQESIAPDTFVDNEVIDRLVDKTRKIFTNGRGLKIGVNEIKIGMSRTELIRMSGNPNRMEKSGGVSEWYVYNSNYNNFVMVSVYENVVSGFFTNCGSFDINGIKSGSIYEDEDEDDDAVTYYIDGNGRIDGIYYNVYDEGMNRIYAEKDIADIINSARAKNGLSELVINNDIVSDRKYNIFGGSALECYEKLLMSGNNLFSGVKRGNISVSAKYDNDALDIMIMASNNENAKRNIETVQPEMKYYTPVNEAECNMELPAIKLPQEGMNLSGDVYTELEGNKRCRVTISDNETLEIIVNEYLTYTDKITYPKELFKEGGDYVLTVHTLDEELSESVEFSYGTPGMPEIISPKEGSTVYSGDVSIIWEDENYSEFLIELFDKDKKLLASLRVSNDNEAEVSGVVDGDYYIRVSSMKKNTNDIKTYSENYFTAKSSISSITINNPSMPPVQAKTTASSPIKFKSDKYARIFGEGKGVYTSKAEADANMVNITIPIWRIEDGKKTASKTTLSVNRVLADEVYQIFYEIYLGPEQFPIKSVGAYSWRSTATGTRSQHSYGTAIDINPDENYCIYNSGKKIGSFWRPGENVYSIKEDGDVVRAFKKYGWTWGAEWKSLKDYMHFSYLGN